MSLNKYGGLDPNVEAAARYAEQLANANGFSITVTSTKRGWAQQTSLFQHWQRCVAEGHAYDESAGCKYPANAPGDSAHQFGWAYDSVPDDPSFWDWWVQIREYVGFRVPANDLVHAEVPDWRSYRDAAVAGGNFGR